MSSPVICPCSQIISDISTISLDMCSCAFLPLAAVSVPSCGFPYPGSEGFRWTSWVKLVGWSFWSNCDVNLAISEHCRLLGASETCLFLESTLLDLLDSLDILWDISSDCLLLGTEQFSVTHSPVLLFIVTLVAVIPVMKLSQSCLLPFSKSPCVTLAAFTQTKWGRRGKVVFNLLKLRQGDTVISDRTDHVCFVFTTHSL